MRLGRRQFAGIVIAFIARDWISHSSAYANVKSQIKIRLELSGADEFRLPPQSQFEGNVHRLHEKGLPVVAVIIVGVIVVSYANRLFRDTYDWAKNGTQIYDFRNKSINIIDRPFSTRQTIIITDNETKVYDREEISDQVVMRAIDDAFNHTFSQHGRKS